jgi:phenylacetate-CoA ligase
MNHIPLIELQPKEQIKIFQEEKLKVMLQYISHHSPYYQRLFKEKSVVINSVLKLEDLASIPVTSKDDLQQHNWDFLCVPKTSIVEYTSTSGTMGQPVTIALTEMDLQRLAYNECISFACADGNHEDLYQLMLTLDRQFMAGIAYYEGIRKLGAGLIRVGPGVPAMQWETIDRLKPTVLVAVPSFLIKLIEFANQQDIDLNKSSVKKAVCIGESLRAADLSLNTLGKKILDSWNLKLYSTYASTEMQTAFTECGYGVGGHHHPELIIVELLDDKNIPVKAGDLGEVTITTLGVEGMPLLRYKTGDVAISYDTVCSCGRTSLRVGPVIGRRQQMIKLKGTTLFPPGIFEILNQVRAVKDYVVEAYTGDLGTDEIRLHLQVEDHTPNIEEELKNAFQARLRVIPFFKFIGSAEIEKLQMEGKSRKVKKFIDHRK